MQPEDMSQGSCRFKHTQPRHPAPCFRRDAGDWVKQNSGAEFVPVVLWVSGFSRSWALRGEQGSGSRLCSLCWSWLFYLTCWVPWGTPRNLTCSSVKWASRISPRELLWGFTSVMPRQPKPRGDHCKQQIRLEAVCLAKRGCLRLCLMCQRQLTSLCFLVFPIYWISGSKAEITFHVFLF